MAGLFKVWLSAGLDAKVQGPNISCLHSYCLKRRPVSQPLAKRNVRREDSKLSIAALPPGSFDIPAAPNSLLIPKGPWEEIDGSVCAAKGFQAQGMYSGLRAKGKKADLALIMCEVDATAAGAFTKNVMCAAPVLYCKTVLEQRDTARAVLVNAGQANAATGEQGYKDTLISAKAVGEALGISPDSILLLSTGVIGKRIKMDQLLQGIPELAKSLGSSPADAHRAGVAITTTDLVSKSAALKVELAPGRFIRIGGIAKGSGMIHPNMATMLAVVTCDAPVDSKVWQGMIKRATAASFNQITVDGDTSTNDTVIGLSSGLSGGSVITDSNSSEGRKLEAALTALLQSLAKSIAWDGEGATMLLECTVGGAKTDEEARAIAKSIVGSSLVKSAMFGHDPNWGRIAAAAGYAGVEYDQAQVRIVLGETLLMEAGQPLAFDEVAASNYLRERAAEHGTAKIEVSIGKGPGVGQAWGCDLSYDYVKINAEYTT